MISNETLKESEKVQKETAKRQMQHRLNKQINDERKVLMAKLALVKDHNTDTANKLKEEKKKFDDLQEQNMHVGEQLHLQQVQHDKNIDSLKETDEEIKFLTEKKNNRTKKLDDLLKDLDAARQINDIESEKNRAAQVLNAAYTTKLEFIEKHYEYTDQIHKLNSDLFRNINRTNVHVSTVIALPNIFKGWLCFRRIHWQTRECQGGDRAPGSHKEGCDLKDSMLPSRSLITVYIR